MENFLITFVLGLSASAEMKLVLTIMVICAYHYCVKYLKKGTRYPMKALPLELELKKFNSTKISELIGIGFDENTVWGKLDIGELKILIYLALEHYEIIFMLSSTFHKNEKAYICYLGVGRSER